MHYINQSCLSQLKQPALQSSKFYLNVEQVGFMTHNLGGFSVGSNANNVQSDNNQYCKKAIRLSSVPNPIAEPKSIDNPKFIVSK